MICNKCNTKAELKEFTTFSYHYCNSCKIEVKEEKTESYPTFYPKQSSINNLSLKDIYESIKHEFPLLNKVKYSGLNIPDDMEIFIDPGFEIEYHKIQTDLQKLGIAYYRINFSDNQIKLVRNSLGE